MRRPEVTAAIAGARRPSDIEETAAAGDWILATEEREAIGQMLATAEP